LIHRPRCILCGHEIWFGELCRFLESGKFTHGTREQCEDCRRLDERMKKGSWMERAHKSTMDERERKEKALAEYKKALTEYRKNYEKREDDEDKNGL